ncbi:S8 family peptidase [Anaeromicropila populeti]|uniref:Subtilase family protein n=1 Tax=Anaeromicropila populeti TaxID=37658 RepID=A0A1I6J1B6_9FIRM|nr:S8 family peptidase [Anaeromicropila populeti]SFR72729.1 Subtilase family protein [Anaeromicropila populeti]
MIIGIGETQVDPECRKRIISEAYADFMIDYGVSLDTIVANLGACYEPLIEDTAIAYVPIENIPKNFFQLYGYGAYPNCYGLLDIGSLDASGVSKIQNIPNFDLFGQGVLIGLVDSGIDYTHSTFRNVDGTSKIAAIWDQTIESDSSQPEGFSFGTEYTQSQLNFALTSPDPFSVVPSTDDVGHGTFLAGIAAGNRIESNSFSGVVPDAQLAVVKLKPAKKYLRDFWRIPDDAVCYQKHDLIHGINYLVKLAEQLKMPISILIGIGTSQGAHDERGALSSYLSTISTKKGVSLTIAGGNEGNTGHHYYGTIEKEEEFDEVELKVGPNEQGFSMELWAKTPTTFSIDLRSPNGEYIARIPARLGESREIKFILESTVINVDYQIAESQSGDQLILVRFRNPSEGIWKFKVYKSGNLALNYHIWLPMSKFLNYNTFFIKSDPNYTLTSPGNTFIPIVTTAYNYIDKSIYLESSRGFMRNDNIAPTLAAPGVNMIGPALQHGYTIGSGTSISAAHTAGVAAMFLEWGIIRGFFPSMSTVEIKILLIRGAQRNPNLSYPNKEWGYGILDLYNAYVSLRGDE